MKVKLKNDPAFGNYQDRNVYTASATAEDGLDYQVEWECVAGWESGDDESAACNWDDYTVYSVSPRHAVDNATIDWESL